jgi:hypothetical protein
MLLGILLTSCGSQNSSTNDIVATADVSNFSGRLLLIAEGKYYQVTLGEDFSYEEIATTDTFENFSPRSASWHIYYAPSRVGITSIVPEPNGERRNPLVDITTGQTLIPLPPKERQDDCASLSPDGDKVAVVAETGLYIATPDGQARLVLPSISRIYQRDSVIMSTTVPADLPGSIIWAYVMPGRDLNLVGEISCPTWIDSNRFLVDHFVGSFPEELDVSQQRPPNEANTTSIINILPTTPEIIDVQQRWVVARSRAPVWVLMRIPDDAESPYQVNLGRPSDWRYYLGHPEALVTPFRTHSEFLSSWTEIIPSGSIASDFVFSNDNTQIAFETFVQEDSVYYINIWNILTNTLTHHIPIPRSMISGDIMWAPNSQAIVFNTGVGIGRESIYLVHLDEPEQLQHLVFEELEMRRAVLLTWAE